MYRCSRRPPPCRPPSYHWWIWAARRQRTPPIRAYPNTGKLQVWPLDQDQSATTFSLSTVVVFNNLEARISFALQGLGIAYLPDFSIRMHLAEGRLVHVLPHCTEPETMFRITWPSGKHFTAKLRVFIDFLCERLFIVE